MNKFKTAAASVLAAAMILSLTACDEEPAVSGSNSGVSNADAPNADGTSGNNAGIRCNNSNIRHRPRRSGSCKERS